MFNLLCRAFLGKKRLLLAGERCNNQDVNIVELRVELLFRQLKVSLYFLYNDKFILSLFIRTYLGESIQLVAGCFGHVGLCTSLCLRNPYSYHDVIVWCSKCSSHTRTVTPGECTHNPGKSLARNAADAPRTLPLNEWSVEKSVSSGYQVEMVTKEDVLGPLWTCYLCRHCTEKGGEDRPLYKVLCSIRPRF